MAVVGNELLQMIADAVPDDAFRQHPGRRPFPAPTTTPVGISGTVSSATMMLGDVSVFGWPAVPVLRPTPPAVSGVTIATGVW